MKPFTAKALSAAVGAVLAAGTVSAQNTYNNGDLFLAFRESGKNDLVIDIGNILNYANATSTINLDTVVASFGNPTYSTLSSLISADFGSGATPAAGLTWSVFGAPALGGPYSGIYLTDPSGSSSAFNRTSMNNAGTAFQSYVSGWIQGTAGTELVQNLAFEEVHTVSSSYTVNGPKIAGDIGFNQESLVPDTGSSTAGLEMFDSGDAGSTAPNDGYFEINPDGTGAYVVTETPEPATTAFGIVAGAGLLIMNLRRRVSRPKA
jgi:hypothetical protein